MSCTVTMPLKHCRLTARYSRCDSLVFTASCHQIVHKLSNLWALNSSRHFDLKIPIVQFGLSQPAQYAICIADVNSAKQNQDGLRSQPYVSYLSSSCPLVGCIPILQISIQQRLSACESIDNDANLQDQQEPHASGIMLR
jgi:hypothetical protein